MLKLLLALSGILWGYGLAYFTAEEIHAARKYLIILQHVLYFVLVATLANLIWRYPETSGITSVLLLSGFFLLFIVQQLRPSRYWEIAAYSLFILLYLQYPLPLIAAVIFLYGLPAGTLLR